MSPSQYEQYVSHLYSEKGFDTEVTSYHSDYGMDVLAEKGMERICIQVKMFGNSNR